MADALPTTRLVRATYRLQFHAGFTFADAEAIVPYLDALGVSHIYASPIFAACDGSTHNYDVTDPLTVNPVLGGEAGLRALTTALHGRGMGLLVDFVPNHMAASWENPYWDDMLALGAASPHARLFDLDTADLTPPRKVRLPILGDWLDSVLDRKEIAVALDPARGRLDLTYFNHRTPLSPASQAALLSPLDLSTVTDPLHAGNHEGLATARAALAQIVQTTAHRATLDATLARLNADPAALRALLGQQVYQLAHWRSAAMTTSYRRFFDINGLVALRMEDPAVFTFTHDMLLTLIGQGVIDGLRLDHVDGLRDPGGYLARLRDAASQARGHSDPFPVYVEKILAADEPLQDTWATDGTTGYDFLYAVNALLVNDDAEHSLTGTAARFGARAPLDALVAEAKQMVVRDQLAGDIARVTRAFARALASDPGASDLPAPLIARALERLACALSVYRTYADDRGGTDWDVAHWRAAAAQAEATLLPWQRTALTLVMRVIMSALRPAGQTPLDPGLARAALQDFQQVTGALMAKALEDTAFYRYPRLLSLNEVGGEPDHFGMTNETFHARMAARAHAWPRAMLATATHDHKRGEDVRTRISTLSEVPTLWADTVTALAEQLAPLRMMVQGRPAPSDTDLYILLQTLIGVWPVEATPDWTTLRERVVAAMQKTAREAKRHTSWHDPDAAYESAMERVVRTVLDPDLGGAVFNNLQDLVNRLAPAAAAKSLAQTVLKLTCPGVPDIYQGTERWDFSLVDPDNRRPVDFAQRRQPLPDGGDWRSGAMKQHIITALLTHRRAAPELYLQGGYTALTSSGERAPNLIAFTRTHASRTLVVTVPTRMADCRGESLALTGWDGTAVTVPEGLAHRPLRDVLTGTTLTSTATLSVEHLFEVFPVSVLDTDLTAL